MLTDILQPTHLIFLLVIALLILGPKRLPEAGRSLGQGLKEFRSSISGRYDGEAPAPAAAPRLEETTPGDPPG
ncbi:MAG TPA: twin-arginine translocase TatA/TatE family subunit [Solirubrobacteraceae bacterium]|jgi:sec-independent protein translocase protein TatA|nr:twin-arginine translocase TatA/TatE family subunit [Solirubrobacteraceae bacterium]